MRRILIIPFCLLMTMFIGCGGTETQSDEPQVDSSAFRIAILPVNECRPFHYADSCGWFDSLGVNVELVEFEAAMDADTAFMNGSVDMSVVDEIKFAFLNNMCDSDSIYKVLDAPLKLSLITSKPARIKSIKSLKEKIIAVTRNSALDYLSDRIAEKANLTELEINRPQINNIRLRAGMLMQNQYDGAILPEPWATECVDSGAVRVATSDQIKKLRFCVVVRDSVLKTKKEQVKKVRNAFEMAEERISGSTKNVH